MQENAVDLKIINSFFIRIDAEFVLLTTVFKWILLHCYDHVDVCIKLFLHFYNIQTISNNFQIVPGPCFHPALSSYILPVCTFSTLCFVYDTTSIIGHGRRLDFRYCLVYFPRLAYVFRD
jgi:hypothetical protein